MRKLLVALIALALAGCAPGAPRLLHPAPASPPPTSAPPRPGTTRPTPARPATATVPVDSLAGRLDAAIAGTNSCLLVTDATTGAVRYTHQADVPLAPASTQKLLVAAAALDRLGPAYRFTTTVAAARPPSGGAVDDLWLVGAGDPLLATPAYIAYLQGRPATAGYPATPLAALADQLIAAGVRQVRNGIHGDDSRYEVLRYLPSWPAQLNQGEFDIGPLGALEVDQGLDRWLPSLPTPDPTGHAGGALTALFNARGGSGGRATDGVAPSGAVVLARVESAPLAQIVAAMLRASDNQIAELLVRELDRQGGGRGTTAGGVGIVMAEAAHLGLPTAGLSLVDGSGLSATNHVTCRTLLGALDLGDQPRFSALATGLPVAGVSGTLYDLFRNTPAAGRLAAKGGYITGVSALVGRLDEGHPLRFAFVVNGTASYLDGLGLSERVVGALGNQ